MSSMCCTVSYIYMYVCIYFVVLGKGYLTFVACLQSLNFSLADFYFFLLLFCFRFVFSLCWPFFRESRWTRRAQQQRRSSKGGAGTGTGTGSTFMRPRRQHGPEHEEQKWQNSSSRQAAGSRQHATGWGSCQILVLVSGCGATCCPGCVHECECVCCDQHCWSTHSHTHTHTPVQTLPGCVVIFFSFSLPCCCLPLPALVIIVFAFFSSFFLLLVGTPHSPSPSPFSSAAAAVGSHHLFAMS